MTVEHAPSVQVRIAPEVKPDVNGEADRWLTYIRRLVTRIEDPTLDLRERLDSLGTAAQALDTFFQVKVQRFVDAASNGAQPTVSSTGDAADLATRCALTFRDDLCGRLQDYGVQLLRPNELLRRDRAQVSEFFMRAVFPLLTPMSVDPGRPFPRIADLSLNIAALIEGSKRRGEFVRIEVPRHLPRFLRFSERHVFVPVEECIGANLHHIFQGVSVREHHAFRLTRALFVDDADEPARSSDADLVRVGNPPRPPVRLELDAAMPAPLVAFLTQRVGVPASHTHVVPGPIDLSTAPSLLTNGTRR